MTRQRFGKFLERDKRCWHCGLDDGSLIPHHRRNRGMGGSKLLDAPANILVMCSFVNGLMESNPEYEALALSYGWKLRLGDNPERQPVFDRSRGLWFLLDNSFGRQEVDK